MQNHRESHTLFETRLLISNTADLSTKTLNGFYCLFLHLWSECSANEKRKWVKVRNKGKGEDIYKPCTLHYMDHQSLNILNEGRLRTELGKNKAGVYLYIGVCVRKGSVNEFKEYSWTLEFCYFAL